jgi:hypothetical protein
VVELRVKGIARAGRLQQPHAAARRIDQRADPVVGREVVAPLLEIGRDQLDRGERRRVRVGAWPDGQRDGERRRIAAGQQVDARRGAFHRLGDQVRRFRRSQVGIGGGIGGLDQSRLGGEAAAVDRGELRGAADRGVLDARREAGEVEPPARDRRAHFPLARGEAVLALAAAWLEQRDVAPRGIERELPRRDFERRHPGDRIGVLPEQVQVDLGDVVAAEHAAVAAEVGVVRQVVVRVVDHAVDPRRAQVGKAPLRAARDRPRQRPAVEHVPIAEQPAERLVRHRIPVGDVVGEQLGETHGAEAPAVVDRALDVDTLAGAIEPADRPRAEQRADIGDRPVVGLVDPAVCPHPVDRAAGNRRLLREHADEAAQRTVVGRGTVLGAVDLGDEIPDSLLVMPFEQVFGRAQRGVGHRVTSRSPGLRHRTTCLRRDRSRWASVGR